MYINGHLALPHCMHLINLKCVRSKKNCDQKNSLTSLFKFFILTLSFQLLSVLKHLTEASP